jgi:hypothetical protein
VFVLGAFGVKEGHRFVGQRVRKNFFKRSRSSVGEQQEKVVAVEGTVVEFVGRPQREKGGRRTQLPLELWRVEYDDRDATGLVSATELQHLMAFKAEHTPREETTKGL